MIKHTGTRPLGRLLVAVALIGAASLAGCDFLDPTSVDNPRTTDEDLESAENPTLSLLPGLRAQFARMVHSTVVVTETVSDNYSIHGTGLNNTYDTPSRIRPVTVNSMSDATGVYWNAQELRALADFIIDEIAPTDETAPAEAVAEAHYYRGMALLSLAENFVGAPVEPEAPPLEPAALLERAETDLLAATDGEGDVGTAARAALARTYRWMGDAAQAASYASAALAASPDFLWAVEADATSVDNEVWAYVVSRQLREMQPLPRLDFLDPKYLTIEAEVPVAKAEEMHLILAEAAMAQGDWGGGASHLAAAIRQAQGRRTVLFDDNDTRINSDGTVRPRDEEILVAAGPSAPFRAGLVFERPGTIPVPVVSSSSLNADSIAAMTGSTPADQDALLHALYLARQEILFLEGRRMADLGIRLPIMLREIEVNTQIAEGDFGTEVFVPAYIPPENQLDVYTPHSPYPDGTDPDDTEVEPQTLQAVISHDMNAILVQNRATALPLF